MLFAYLIDFPDQTSDLLFHNKEDEAALTAVQIPHDQGNVELLSCWYIQQTFQSGMPYHQFQRSDQGSNH